MDSPCHLPQVSNLDVGKDKVPPLKPMSVIKALLGSCACGTISIPFPKDGVSSSVQIVELHGIRCIGLGALTDELTPRERVYDTLEQLTTRTDRLISLGYMLSKGAPAVIGPEEGAPEVRRTIETVPLDVWSQNFPKDKNITREIKRIIDLVQRKEFDQVEKELEKKLEDEIRNITKKNNAFSSGITAHNVGVLKLLLGKENESVHYFRRAITLKEAAFVNDPHEIALSWGELGIQHFARGDFEEALASFHRAHELESIIVSKEGENPALPKAELAMILNNIGCCYFQMGKREEAHRSLQAARDLQHELVGLIAQADLDLLHVATVICNCGYLKLALRKYEEAQSLFEEGLLIQQSVLEEDHRAIRDTRSNIEFSNVFHSVD